MAAPFPQEGRPEQYPPQYPPQYPGYQQQYGPYPGQQSGPQPAYPYPTQPQQYGQPYPPHVHGGPPPGEPYGAGAGQWQQPPPQQYGQPYGDSVGIGIVEPDRGQQAQAGGWDDDYWNIEEDKKLREDVDISVRMGFIRKVYGILSCQLLITFGMALWFNLHRAAAQWLYNNIWVMLIGIVIMCASVCTLTCVPKAGRKVPLNYILLFALALSMGVILGYSTGAVNTPAFAMAAGMTAAVTVAVSLFACQTKWDFTGCGVYAFVALILLMIFGLVAGLVRNRITQLVYASLGAALFSFYLIMDTQKIVGGKHRKYQFSIDDYAFGALALYLDIINLFMFILQILALTDNA